MKRGENASQSPPERRGFLPSFQKSDMEGQMTMRTLLNRRRERGFTLVEIMIVVLIIGILLAIAVPSFMNARERSRANACRSNLRQIQAAKEQWAMATNQGPTATPDWTCPRAELSAAAAEMPLRRNLHDWQPSYQSDMQQRQQRNRRRSER
jgi:prepilin-type N-terminal cleavage/methylation domain-containing protein